MVVIVLEPLKNAKPCNAFWIWRWIMAALQNLMQDPALHSNQTPYVDAHAESCARSCNVRWILRQIFGAPYEFDYLQILQRPQDLAPDSDDPAGPDARSCNAVGI